MSATFCMVFINAVWASWVLYRFYFKSFKLISYLKRLVFYFVICVIAAAVVWLICYAIPVKGDIARLICNALVCLIVPPIILYPLFRILPEAKSAFQFVLTVLKVGIKHK